MKYEKYKKIFENKGCVLLTTEEEFINLKQKYINIRNIHVLCKEKCGHINEVNLSNFIYCKNNYCTNLCKVYNKYKDMFNKNNCLLITSYEECIRLRKEVTDIRNINVTYKASCGHINTKAFLSFKRTKNYLCDDCLKKIKSENNKLPNGGSRTLKLEDDVIKLIIKELENKFEIIKNNDGCLSDLCVKINNKWMCIQLKTCENPSTQYSFGVSDKYKNCLIICYCINDKRMWLFDGNEIKNKSGISIGIKKSKYDKNEIKSYDELINKIKTTKIKLYDLEECNTPISQNNKIEFEFKKLREKKMSKYLKFEYQNYSNLVYDFKIGPYKIQEKVGFKKFKTTYFNMSKHGGIKSKKVPYQKGDNDYYWLNFRCGTKFMFIPESKLDCIGKKTMLRYNDSDTYLNEFIYEYPADDSSCSNFNWIKKLTGSN